MAHAAQTLKTILDNGLTVLIRESHRAPVASFWVWYRVGGRNEVPGITGISHWVEHMVFKGTQTYGPGEIFRLVNKHGGTLNGFTWLDYTAYFETLPAPQILLAADIEADRMQNAVFDPTEVESERTVILSEREGNENQPTFHLREEVVAAAFRAHPYGQGVIGHVSDLRQITRDDLYRHYRTYYVPNNATVVVVGDVDAQATLAEIERRFGAIPAGPEPAPVRTAEPPQQGERRVVVRRPAPNPTLLMAFHAPAAEHPDALPMMLLDTVLSGGKAMGFGGGGGMGRSSRLYRALVASGLCSAAGSSFTLTIDPYLMTISAALVPSAEPARVEAIVQEELARLREEPVPEEELARAVKQLRAQFAYAGESVSSQAYWLGALRTVAPGLDPDTVIDRLAALTPDDLLRVARTYLTPDQATVGWLEPTAIAPSPADVVPLAARPHFLSDARGSGAGAFPAPRLDLREHTLDSGLRLLGHHDPTSDAAVLGLRLPTGAVADGETPGLARFTAQMLPRGTAHRTFAELNEELDSLGAGLSVSPGRDYVDIAATCLKEDVARLAELLAEVVLEPAFPEDEIERMREQSLTALRQALNDTRAQASHTLRSTIYPAGHPYHHRVLGTETTLSTISRDALITFHRRYYQPERAILAVSGGVPVEEAWDQVQRVFGGWRTTETLPAVDIPPVDPPPGRVRREEQLPGKSQADIALGLPALERSHPDYDALRVANLILGRLGLMGRLGASVRERQGMAYYVYSSLEAGRGRGLWAAHAGVNPVNVERAVESIIAEVERFRGDLPTTDELEDAKSYLIGSLPLSLESSGAIAGTALDIAFYDLGLDYIERLPARIAALTREQIREVAARYLLPDRMVVVIVGPQAATWP
ncbi:MAG: pitrilysin family protein [Sphaerobacter sp.]|nr:pitrilysin family protein [Sphaerobacter sp.]